MSHTFKEDRFKSAWSNLPRHYCVCDGPAPGDAQFVISWLTEVLAVDRHLEKYFLEHPEFRSRIDLLEMDNMVEFRAPAMVMISKWLKRVDAFYVDLEAWYGELFAIMANIGFFELDGDHYKMTIPPSFEIEVLATALLRLAKTADCEFRVHPEKLLHTMDWLAAKRCQRAIKQSKKAIGELGRQEFTVH